MDEDKDRPFLLEIRPETKNRYPFPNDKLDIEKCKKSTENFARWRLKHMPQFLKMTDQEKDHFEKTDEMIIEGIRQNPIHDYYVLEYPLPIGIGAIQKAYMKHRWDSDPTEIIPSPIVEKIDAYAGLIERRCNGDTTGYFIGLVKMHDMWNLTETETVNLTEDEKWWLYYATQFEFTEGMILLEGKLDKKVIRDLKKYEKEYNETILGTVFTLPGRPSTDPEEYLGPARIIIRKFPDITQKDLCENYLFCLPRTFREHTKNAKFTSYRQFKNSVLKK